MQYLDRTISLKDGEVEKDERKRSSEINPSTL
jgi:hypothetical protein